MSAMTAALVGISVPSFVLGPVLVLVIALRLHVLPPAGWGDWQHVILPGLTLGTIYAASIARLTRGGMLEVIRSDFIRTARAKGLSEKLIVGGTCFACTVAGCKLSRALLPACSQEVLW